MCGVLTQGLDTILVLPAPFGKSATSPVTIDYMEVGITTVQVIVHTLI